MSISSKKSNTDAIQVFPFLVLEQLYKMMQCNFPRLILQDVTYSLEQIYIQAF